MKKALFLLLPCMFLFYGCESVNLVDQVTLEFDASKTEIILAANNEYNETVDLTWKLINQSENVLDSNSYELSLRSARPNSYEATLIHIPEFSVEPFSETSGSYTYHIDGISAEGEFEFQFVLSEKNDDYTIELKTTSLPFSLYWGE